MYAIIEIGSHQYRVEEDSDLTVFRRENEEGEQIEIDNVLLIRNDSDTEIGQPYLEKATVQATVEEHFRGEKITVYNYKPRDGRRRKLGHRDDLTRLRIDSIQAG